MQPSTAAQIAALIAMNGNQHSECVIPGDIHTGPIHVANVVIASGETADLDLRGYTSSKVTIADGNLLKRFNADNSAKTPGLNDFVAIYDRFVAVLQPDVANTAAMTQDLLTSWHLCYGQGTNLRYVPIGLFSGTSGNVTVVDTTLKPRPTGPFIDARPYSDPTGFVRIDYRGSTFKLTLPNASAVTLTTSAKLAIFALDAVVMTRVQADDAGLTGTVPSVVPAREHVQRKLDSERKAARPRR